ncbi:MAG: bifunctional folylpolyglutamate synthase/dihydrofolate synthase [Phycisphaerae bacterium]|nr:bifunctional folylpolyglutamate synthase/dihydrofolate synthase [Phycisphaerae bacterium]
MARLRTPRTGGTGAVKRKPSSSRKNGVVRTYRSALSFINSVTDYEKQSRVGYNHTNFSLSRMNRLLKALGDPHKKVRAAHIAGTKGKGSTATMLANMLQGCGYTVGLYTSPHLIDIRERITVNGHMIAESEMTRIIAKIAPAVKRLGKDSPTFFEIMTAAAWMHFVEKKADIAVMETGMGGRLDSTNVIKPAVCGITSISFDHTAQLGKTLSKIAEEKAGIFKAGVPVVSAPQTPEVKRVLKRVAMKNRAPLRFTGEDIEFSYRFESSRAVGPHTRVCLTTEASRFEHLHVPLLGEHQAINCGVALGLVDALKSKGFSIDDQKAIEGLSRVCLPGRMEVIHEDPRILVDGAHNGSSIEALIRAIGQNITYDSMVLIFGCQADKDVQGMLEQIQYGADKVIFVATSSPRSSDPTDLAARFAEMSGKMAQVAGSVREALTIACHAVDRDDLICVTGSFYLVGEAKHEVARNPSIFH